jgi:hypothetical protein
VRFDGWNPRLLLARVTTGEWVVAGIVGTVLLVLVVLEPDILGAPVENVDTMAFTIGGTVAAAIALVMMLRFRVSPMLRVVVLLVPFVLVNWWLLSPFFFDEVVDEDFTTSIGEQLDQREEAATTTAPVEPDETDEPGEPEELPSTGPMLLGAGTFTGLAGHSGSGAAGLFRDDDGSYALRFEDFDIDNGPDLVVYLVPGSDQTSIAAGSIDLGSLKGNVGDQTYTLPPGTDLAPGAYTALVWCDAFSVEFVGATISIS